MKRVSNLWERLCSLEIAVEAIYRGTENKREKYEVLRRFGYPDSSQKSSVHYHQLDPEKVRRGALALISIYRSGWTPSPLRPMHLAIPGHKERDLSVPSLTDHLLGWMLILAIYDLLMRGMYDFCCGSIPGRGIEYARKAIQRWVQHDRESKYFVKLDIRKYYENVDRGILKAKFRRVIKDKKYLEVLDKHIDMCPKGLPVGTYPAPWFANFYLQELDYHIMQDLFKTRRGKRTNYVKHYLRYIDDMLLIGSSKRDLEKAVREVVRFCMDELSLEVKPCWEIREIGELIINNGEARLRSGTCPIDMVGYKFYREQGTVRGDIYLHTSRLAAKMSKRLSMRGYILLHDARAFLSLIGWFSHANSKQFLTDINDKINVNLVKEVVSYADKNRIVGEAARVYCGQRAGNGSYYILHGRDGSAPRR